jgi:hypothetical protein
LSDTGEETGLQWNSTSAIYRLKANLWLRGEILHNVLTQFGIPMKLLT